MGGRRLKVSYTQPFSCKMNNLKEVISKFFVILLEDTIIIFPLFFKAFFFSYIHFTLFKCMLL